MDKLVYLLPVLGCAAMMGAMMWMMRGSHGTAVQQPDPTTQEEIAMLRAEIATLRAAPTPPPDTAEQDTAAQRGGTA